LQRIGKETRGLAIVVLLIEQLALSDERVRESCVSVSRVNEQIVRVLEFFEQHYGFGDKREFFSRARRVLVVVANKLLGYGARFVFFALLAKRPCAAESRSKPRDRLRVF